MTTKNTKKSALERFTASCGLQQPLMEVDGSEFVSNLIYPVCVGAEET